jgi:hypothetical protein
MRRIFSLLFLSVVALLGCGSSEAVSHHSDAGLDAASADAGPDGPGDAGSATTAGFGFNAKGSLNTLEQLTLAEPVLKGLSAKLRARLVIRVNGGTASQQETSADWTDVQVSQWASLQSKHKIRLSYVVNGNDTPAGQAAFVQRWRQAGVEFAFLELMNEYYLAKFRNGDTTKPEVTRKVTIDDYVDEIVPAFQKELAPLKIPTFVIAAPANPSVTGTDWNAAWNDGIVAAFTSRSEFQGLGVTLHLYDRCLGSYEYAQIDELRVRLPPGTPIAITEAGLLCDSLSTYDQVTAKLKPHLSGIHSKLLPGDYLLDQVLYNPYANDVTATVHPSTSGITPKGQAVVDLFEEWAGKN